jgi:hypothetical protein
MDSAVDLLMADSAKACPDLQYEVGLGFWD